MSTDEYTIAPDYLGPAVGFVIPNPDPEFAFTIKGEMVLRLNAEGFIYNGQIVKDAGEVYHAFRMWLRHQMCMRCGNEVVDNSGDCGGGHQQTVEPYPTEHDAQGPASSGREGGGE